MSNYKNKTWPCFEKESIWVVNCHDDVRTCQGRRMPAQSGLRAQGQQGHTHKLRPWLRSAPPLFWSSLASQRITSARPRQDLDKCEYFILKLKNQFLFRQIYMVSISHVSRYVTLTRTWHCLRSRSPPPVSRRRRPVRTQSLRPIRGQDYVRLTNQKTGGRLISTLGDLLDTSLHRRSGKYIKAFGLSLKCKICKYIPILIKNLVSLSRSHY